MNSPESRNVLFLCTGNACRSQIAEGWLRHLAPDLVVKSAGIEAHGVNPRAVAAMRECGVDISAQTSDIVSARDLEQAAIVITVCGNADDRCPPVPSGCVRLHWPIDDPAALQGDEAEITAGFRACRDELKGRIEQFVAEL